MEMISVQAIDFENNRENQRDGDFLQLVESVRVLGLIEPPVVRRYMGWW